MALPLTFANSFWSPAFDTSGLFAKLRAGVVENGEVLRFVNERAQQARATARSLDEIAQVRFSKTGFAKDDGASLRRTIEGLKYETAQVAKAHDNVASNLEGMVVVPFTTWSDQHEVRITELKERLDELVGEWEALSNEVRKLKDTRTQKCNLADEAEDDLRFAPMPSSPPPPSSSSSKSAGTAQSPRARSTSSTSASSSSQAFATAASATATQAAQQAAQAAQSASHAASSIARSFSQRLKVSPTTTAVKTRFERMRAEAKERELASRGGNTDSPATSLSLDKEKLVDEEGKPVEGSEKAEIVGAEKQAGVGAPSTSPAATLARVDELEIGRVVKHPKDWSIIFAQAKTKIPTTAVKVPLLGTTPDAHSGEDLVLWFRENLDELGGSLSRSHEFCRQLSEELSILRLVGELGNKFIDSSDAFYAWRPEAFHLDEVQMEINAAEVESDHPKDGANEGPLTDMPKSSRERKGMTGGAVLSPKNAIANSPLPPLPEHEPSPASPVESGASASLLARGGTITSYLSTAYGMAASNVSSLNARIAKASSGSADGRYERLKKEADEAEAAYRVGIRELDELRMVLEETTSTTLSRAQKLEMDRLKALKSVLTTYNATIASLNTPLQLSSERSALLQEAFQPVSDVNTIIERYRTGPFRPRPNVWIDAYHEQTDVRFGLDLRHWRDTHDQIEKMPDVFRELLDALADGYANLSSDEERRKTWIYDVPLQYTHRLRNMINSSASALPVGEMRKFDLPVIASTVKLWLLELAVAIVPSPMYNDVKGAYPSVGAEQVDEDKRVADLLALLDRMPKIHLVILDAVVRHLKNLIDSTKSLDDGAEYLSKLGATLGPCIVRPAYDSHKTLNDRFPMQFFSDIVRHYDHLLPTTLAKKDKVEEERYAPKRKRTKMVDERISRSSVQNGQHHDDESQLRLLKEEMEKKTGIKISNEPEQLPQVPEKQEAVIAEASASPLHAEHKETALSQQVLSQEPMEISVPGPGESSDAERPAIAVANTQVQENQERNTMQKLEDETYRPDKIASEILPAAADEDDEDLDKPLYIVGEGNLPRSTHGSGGGARRLQRSTGAGSSSTPAGKLTRGPRPMSMQPGLSTSGGVSPSSTSPLSVTSPTGSPLPAGPAGVRARAAMFEQRGDGSKGHRVTASTSDAAAKS